MEEREPFSQQPRQAAHLPNVPSDGQTKVQIGEGGEQMKETSRGRWCGFMPLSPPLPMVTGEWRRTQGPSQLQEDPSWPLVGSLAGGGRGPWDQGCQPQRKPACSLQPRLGRRRAWACWAWLGSGWKGEISTHTVCLYSNPLSGTTRSFWKAGMCLAQLEEVQERRAQSGRSLPPYHLSPEGGEHG